MVFGRRVQVIFAETGFELESYKAAGGSVTAKLKELFSLLKPKIKEGVRRHRKSRKQLSLGYLDGEFGRGSFR